MQNVAAALENTHLNGDLDVDIGNPSLCDPIMAGQMDALVSNSDTDADDDCEGGLQLVEPIDDEPEFAPEKKEDRYK